MSFNKLLYFMRRAAVSLISEMVGQRAGRRQERRDGDTGRNEC